MKRLLFFLILVFSLSNLNAQEPVLENGFSAGFSVIGFTPDKTVPNFDDLTVIPSIDLRYRNEISDGHHLLVFGEFSGHNEERREGDVWKFDIRTGFAFFINAVPLDDLFDFDQEVNQLRILFGMGFEYDSYYNRGDFVPAIKLHYKHKRLLAEIGIQSHLIDAYLYDLTPELRVGLYYDIFMFEK